MLLTGLDRSLVDYQQLYMFSHSVCKTLQSFDQMPKQDVDMLTASSSLACLPSELSLFASSQLSANTSQLYRL